MRVDDAKRAVDAGVSAISVSNHGGNNLDGTPASIRALPAIAEAVGDDIEVLLDGGIRRGSDVVKAVALGARAVMIGRAYLWGLAANGQAGVENVLDVLRGRHRFGPDGPWPRVGPRSGRRRHPRPAGLRPCARCTRRPKRLNLARPAGGHAGTGVAEETGVINSAAGLGKFLEINCCAYVNNWRTPGEFGLPSAGGFSQRARELDVEAAAEHFISVDRPGRFHRTAWTAPAAGHRHAHRDRRCPRRC